MLSVALGGCKLLSLLFRAIERSHGFLMSVVASGHRLLAAVCSEALTLAEKSLLTVRIYDFFPDYKSVGDNLHAWEEPWFERRLPAAPARILVGACGTGREAVALAARGYQVDALEPAPEFVVESRRRLGGRGRVFALSYEQLSMIVLDGGSATACALHAEPYDAVILGGGSLTHVLDPREQERLLQSIAALCPAGPILASFFCEQSASSARKGAGRASRLGHRVGRRIAVLRGISSNDSDRLSYRSHSGFAYTFTPREVELLAQRIGRELAWEEGNMQPFHYVTFLSAGTGR